MEIILKEATDTSYRKAGESLPADGKVSKEAVKDIVHNLKFPEDNFERIKEKKVVSELFIDADDL